MRLFLVCFDNNDRGAALAGSVVRGATVDDEDVASVNNLDSNFHSHPDAANEFSVFDDVSSDDVQALASVSPPCTELAAASLAVSQDDGRGGGVGHRRC
jgi:hypothetical protein